MKRVLLLNPPAEKLYIRDYYCSFSSKAGYYWPPQDLLVLSGILSQYYDVRVLDCIASGTGIKRGTSIILSYDIDIVIFTTGTTSLKEDLEFARKIKEKKNVIIIASSAIFRFIGYEVMKENSFLDAVITDFVDHDIINYIENDFNNINSIICRKNGAIFNNNIKSLYSNAFYIPIPRHDLFEFRKYRLPTCKRLPFTVTITSKGCPFSCRFCTAGAVGHRLRDLSNIIEEMLLIKNLGVNELLFLDPSLTANKGHILELCKRIIEENIDIIWSCNANVISVLE
nr:hypothetical protein [Candidatus Atribacteria bacterium]